MNKDTKTALKFLGIFLIMIILFIVALSISSKIDKEQKNNACIEIGYKEYIRVGLFDYCLITDNAGIKVIMFQREEGYDAIKIKQEVQE